MGLHVLPRFFSTQYNDRRGGCTLVFLVVFRVFFGFDHTKRSPLGFGGNLSRQRLAGRDGIGLGRDWSRLFGVPDFLGCLCKRRFGMFARSAMLENSIFLCHSQYKLVQTRRQGGITRCVAKLKQKFPRILDSWPRGGWLFRGGLGAGRGC